MLWKTERNNLTKISPKSSYWFVVTSHSSKGVKILKVLGRMTGNWWKMY